MLVIVAIQDLIAVRPEFAATVSASRDRFLKIFLLLFLVEFIDLF